MSDYVVQRHDPTGLLGKGKPRVTLWSRRRQARKKLRRALGGLSGRQWRKYRKATQRAARSDGLEYGGGSCPWVVPERAGA